MHIRIKGAIERVTGCMMIVPFVIGATVTTGANAQPLSHKNSAGARLANGETARVILDHWKVISLRMITEIEPGLPL